MTFIDLCCGIGGFRQGFENNGFQCLLSSDIDENCRKVYFDNYQEMPRSDLSKIMIEDIPDFDVLLSGFPCQPFSISGKGLGFDDIRGTVFFDIMKIVQAKKPKAVVFENVANIIHHDQGNTFKTIINTLEKCGYNVSFEKLNSKNFGVPQSRERIFIVGALNAPSFDFNKLNKIVAPSLSEFFKMDDNCVDSNIIDLKEYTLIEKQYIKKQKSGLIFCGYLNKNIRKNGVREGTLHLSRTHKQVNRIYSDLGYHPTISSQDASGRYYIHSSKGNYVRKLTIDECYKLMGFRPDFIKSEKKSIQYKQIGNSVCISVIEAIAKEIKQQYF